MPARPQRLKRFAGRAIYAWRTDGGGHSFSAPVTVLENQYCDHPWLATGQGRTPPEHNAYVVWGAGDSKTALDLTRSTDGWDSFEPLRRILGGSTHSPPDRTAWCAPSATGRPSRSRLGT